MWTLLAGEKRVNGGISREFPGARRQEEFALRCQQDACRHPANSPKTVDKPSEFRHKVFAASPIIATAMLRPIFAKFVGVQALACASWGSPTELLPGGVFIRGFATPSVGINLFLTCFTPSARNDTI